MIRNVVWAGVGLLVVSKPVFGACTINGEVVPCSRLLTEFSGVLALTVLAVVVILASCVSIILKIRGRIQNYRRVNSQLIRQNLPEANFKNAEAESRKNASHATPIGREEIRQKISETYGNLIQAHDRENPRGVIVLTTLALGISAIILVSSINSSLLLMKGKKASGTVVMVKKSHGSFKANKKSGYIIVKFTSEDGLTQEFRNSVYNSASYVPGQQVQVIYNPTDSTDARLDSFYELWRTPAALSLFVIPLWGSCVAVIRKRKKNKSDREWLTKFGNSVSATVIAINQSVVVNGKSYFTIEYQWTDLNTGDQRTARSEVIPFNPSVSGYVTIGQKIEVLVDPNNPSRTYFDIQTILNRSA
ncbi:MAG TPA: DUF3592 domain-containing protein [Oligoflexia bacterium]|nr:DUF3592 domain-containing protein [Oligoflexia bacterium]